MEDGSKTWFLPLWQFPGLLAKLLSTPAILTEGPLISFQSEPPSKGTFDFLCRSETTARKIFQNQEKEIIAAQHSKISF